MTLKLVILWTVMLSMNKCGDGVMFMLLCVILLFVGCAWSVKWKFFNSYVGEILI